MRILQFILFISLFVVVFYGMHFYVFARLYKFFGIDLGWVSYSVIAAFALSYPIASLLVRLDYNLVSRSLYTLASVWMGVIFFALTLVLLRDIISLFINLDQFYSGIIIVSGVVLLSLVSLVLGISMTVKDVEIPIEGLGKELNLVQLSDIHLGTIYGKDHTEKIVSMTNSLRPDYVLITGDLFDGSGGLIEEALRPFDDLHAPAYFVTGNHEVYEDVDKVMGLLEKTSLKPLRNEAVDLGEFQLIGLDFDERNRKEMPFNGVKVANDKPSVLMYHAPQALPDAASSGIDLMLSGHTHNGQIIPFTFIVKLFYPKTKGYYKIGDMHLYVSPGTGTWGPPMRLGSRNEITNIRLVPR